MLTPSEVALKRRHIDVADCGGDRRDWEIGVRKQFLCSLSAHIPAPNGEFDPNRPMKVPTKIRSLKTCKAGQFRHSRLPS